MVCYRRHQSRCKDLKVEPRKQRLNRKWSVAVLGGGGVCGQEENDKTDRQETGKGRHSEDFLGLHRNSPPGMVSRHTIANTDPCLKPCFNQRGEEKESTIHLGRGTRGPEGPTVEDIQWGKLEMFRRLCALLFSPSRYRPTRYLHSIVDLLSSRLQVLPRSGPNDSAPC